MMSVRWTTLLLSGLCWVALPRALALDNGLALTPPMGWNSWEAFNCNTDCKYDPNNCMSDRNIRKMADLMVSEGYSAAGYEYVNLDGCWMNEKKMRNSSGHLQPDMERFPYGIKPLADYVHSKGLKFGIILNVNVMGRPGDEDFTMENDTATLAEWGVDYVKLNGYAYRNNSELLDRTFIEFGGYLNVTGRPMVYSCCWPSYHLENGIEPNYSVVADHCNLWRNYKNIWVDWTWKNLDSIIDYFGDNQAKFAPSAGPGHWNDPDLLIVGNEILPLNQGKKQMSLWAILAAPLLMSFDLRFVQPEQKAVLQNEKIIAVNQDRLGIQGRRVYQHDDIEVWTRPIEPKSENYTSFGIAVLNRDKYSLAKVNFTLEELGLTAPGGYILEDLFEDKELFGATVRTPKSDISVTLDESDVMMLKAVVQPVPSPTTTPEPSSVYYYYYDDQNTHTNHITIVKNEELTNNELI